MPNRKQQLEEKVAEILGWVDYESGGRIDQKELRKKLAEFAVIVILQKVQVA